MLVIFEKSSNTLHFNKIKQIPSTLSQLISNFCVKKLLHSNIIKQILFYGLSYSGYFFISQMVVRVR